MKNVKYIVVTGSAGFIGSCMVARLNEEGYNNLVLVDDFSVLSKTANFANKKFALKIHRDQFMEWAELHNQDIEFIIHLGARTDTSLENWKIFKSLNIEYSKAIFEFCTQYSIPMIYASSAATYGNGAHGYDDNEEEIPNLEPMNEYAVSKQEFDKWVLRQVEQPPFWVGLKFFNVYGPNEYHKGRMASVIYHAYRQVVNGLSVTLFKSHKKEYADGGQMRDFIYVKDVVNVILWLMKEQKAPSGIYNLGSGKARSFAELVNALFVAINHNPGINYIDTPEDIREKYQYFTEANMDKLRKAGYTAPFHTLEEGVSDYATNYLQSEKIW